MTRLANQFLFPRTTFFSCSHCEHINQPTNKPTNNPACKSVNHQPTSGRQIPSDAHDGTSSHPVPLLQEDFHVLLALHTHHTTIQPTTQPPKSIQHQPSGGRQLPGDVVHDDTTRHAVPLLQEDLHALLPLQQGQQLCHDPVQVLFAVGQVDVVQKRRVLSVLTEETAAALKTCSSSSVPSAMTPPSAS